MDLFAEIDPARPASETLGPGIMVLRGFALAQVEALRAGIDVVVAHAPFRHLVTPGGFEMSVAMTNCGRLGWVSDRSGYRYDALDPSSGQPWPAMPECFLRLASAAAASAGFCDFEPDACLINRYVAGARLSLHQDKDEGRLDQPIVSVSLGVAATFLMGGRERSTRQRRVPLFHGDVMVWGGPSRLIYHGVRALERDVHDFMGEQRINLTFRKAA